MYELIVIGQRRNGPSGGNVNVSGAEPHGMPGADLMAPAWSWQVRIERGGLH